MAARAWSSLTFLFVTFNALLASAKYTCDTSLGKFYPYCVWVPDDAVNAGNSTKLPTVLFLCGRGARSDAINDVESHSQYDGFGKLIGQYMWGDKSDAAVLAAEKFLVIVPMAPNSDSGPEDTQYWQPEKLDLVVEDVFSKYPQADASNFHQSGYSMGCFGSWRYAVHRPDLVKTLSGAGGNPETASIINTAGQSTTPVTDQLTKLVNTPIHIFSGSYDTTVYPQGAKDAQQTMVDLGSTVSQWTLLDTDHSGLSTIPFDTTLLNWILSHSDSSSSGGSSPVSSSPVASSSKATTPKPTSKSSPVASSPAATSTSGRKKCKPKKKHSSRRRRELGHLDHSSF